MDWEQEAIPDDAFTFSQGGTDVPSSTPSLSPQPPQKRKVSPDSLEESKPKRLSTLADAKVVQDRSHSVVEKRYRENLNQKIADLGDCIPILRHDGKRIQCGGNESRKRNKAMVLTEAMAYIQQLEKRNAYLEEANLAMKDQTQRQERRLQSEIRTAEADTSTVQDDPTEESDMAAQRTTPEGEPKGMIPVPEEMRRLWRNQSQEHYADRVRGDAEETSTGSVQVSGRKYVSRMVVGSIAGFMVVESFTTTTTSHSKHEKREDRGLSALPFSQFPPDLHRVLAHYRGTMLHPSSFLLSSFSKVFLILCILILALFLYLYYSRPPPRKSDETTRSTSQPAPPLASPLEVRQNAWLTSIQTVRVPRHHMLPEFLALTMETAAYLTRQLLGWRCYLWLTGRTEEEEIADIRAWDIALDAQLSGGDPEVSKGRLVLTLWAAGTLPSTPFRLMLKALHIRVMFWQPSHFACVSRVLHKIACLLARYQWRKAARMQERLVRKSSSSSSSSSISSSSGHTVVGGGLGQNEPLPDHLAALLEQSADEVLNDGVIQRTHNIVWNRQTDDHATSVDDSAMQGPLDLIASWFSTSKLQSGLLQSLDETASSSASPPNPHPPSPSSSSPSDSSIPLVLALKTAVPRSLPHASALVAQAVLCHSTFPPESDSDSQSFLSHIKWALPPSFPADDPTSPPSPSSMSARETQILIAAHCWLGLSHLRKTQSQVHNHDTSMASTTATVPFASALRLIAHHRPGEVGLLGSAAVAHALSSLLYLHSRSEDMNMDVQGGAEGEHLMMRRGLREDVMSAMLRLSEADEEVGEERTGMVGAVDGKGRKVLREVLRRFGERGQGSRKGRRRTSNGSLDGDAGYGSMSEGDGGID